MKVNVAITTIMVCHNNEENVLTCVESLLNQSYSNFDLIIVDDFSSDGTIQILQNIRDNRVKIIRNSRYIGRWKIYNNYLKVAQGKYICFTQPDCIAASNKLDVQYQFLERRPRIGCVGSNSNTIEISKNNSSESKQERNSYSWLKLSLISYNPFFLSSLMFRKQTLIKYKLQFSASYGDVAFYDLMTRLSSFVQTYNLRIALVNRLPEETDNSISLDQQYLTQESKLKISQLKNLHIKANSTEKKLHLKLMGQQRLLKNEVEQAYDWLNELLEANEKYKCYNSRFLYKFFDAILQEKMRTMLPSVTYLSRTLVLNLLVEKYSYSSYLEIGVFDPQQNFDHVNCVKKTGVDPEAMRSDIVPLTSDDFFKKLPKDERFDLIFIDGLHHAEQVTRDINNALAHLKEYGTIVCHDMLPENEDMQIVPRQTVKWMGDCWKSWAFYRTTNSNLSMQVIDSDCGMGIIQRGEQLLFDNYLSPLPLDYSFFEEHRDELMNVITPTAFIEQLI